MKPPAPAAVRRGRRFLARWILGSLASALAAALFTASALGVVFGPGETVGGKALDALAAVPRVAADLSFYWNLVAHPVRTAETAHRTYERVEWARERMPTAEEIEGTMRAVDRTAFRLEQGTRMIREGLDSILRLATLNPVDGSLPVGSSIVTIRTGVQNLPRPDSLQATARRGAEVARTAREVLEELPYEEAYEGVRTALANFSDNFAPDERLVTVLFVLLALGGALASPWMAAFWIRQGRPGLVTRYVMRRGMVRWPDAWVEDAQEWPIYDRLRERILAEEREAVG